MLTFLIANWKYALIGLLLFAITGLFAAYQWQRSSLVEAKADKAWADHMTKLQAAKADAMARNMEAIKKHGQRVQVITKEVAVVHEVIKEVPVVTFSGDCGKPVEERNHDAENIERIARGIADYFNTGVLTEDIVPGDRGKVLPQADKAGPGSAEKPE